MDVRQRKLGSGQTDSMDAKDSEFEIAVREFVGAFEVLFHHDWNYAKVMIGDEEDGCTFLKPGLEDETEDWGSRGELLERYRNLRKLMDEQEMPSIVNPNIKSFLETFGNWTP